MSTVSAIVHVCMGCSAFAPCGVRISTSDPEQRVAQSSEDLERATCEACKTACVQLVVKYNKAKRARKIDWTYGVRDHIRQLVADRTRVEVVGLGKSMLDRAKDAAAGMVQCPHCRYRGSQDEVDSHRVAAGSH